MKNKNIVLILTLLLSITICFTGCEKKGINILEQPEDYEGEFYVPSSKKVDEGTALSIIAKINEQSFKIDKATKTKSDDPNVIESYRIECYGISIELFYYKDESEHLKEAREQEKFIIRSEDGTSLKEFKAVANGNFVLMFNSTKDASGNDCTESNNKVTQLFKSLSL